MDLEKTEELLEPKKKKNKNYLLIGIIFLVLICLVTFVIYYFFFKKEDRDSYTFSALVSIGDSNYAIDMENNYSITKFENDSNNKEIIYSDEYYSDILSLYSENNNLYCAKQTGSNTYIGSIDLNTNMYKEIAQIDSTDSTAYFDILLIKNRFYYLRHNNTDNEGNITYDICSIDITGNNETVIKSITYNENTDNAISFTSNGKELFFISNNYLTKLDLNGQNEEQLYSLSRYNGLFQYLKYYKNHLYGFFTNYDSKAVLAEYNTELNELETLYEIDDSSHYLSGFIEDNLVLTPIDIDLYGIQSISIDFKISLVNPFTKEQGTLTNIDISSSDSNLGNISYGVSPAVIQAQDKIYYLFYIQDWENYDSSYMWYRSNLDGSNIEKVSEYTF